jgi:hypothetical protein
MMNGSVQVSVGQRVTCGQRLGKVASSGSSTGPHLHFEPRYSDNTSDDPFSGPCGGNITFWVAQGAYNDLPAETCAGGPPPPPPPPEEGAIKGVIWDRSITGSPNDGGNVRIPGTTITIDGGPATTARDGDAYWTFTLAPGTYRLTATREGYEPATREVTVAAATDAWASLGLEPIAIPAPTPPPPPPPPPDETIDPPPTSTPEERPPANAQPAPAIEPTPVAAQGELRGSACACLSSRPGATMV